MQQRSGLQGSLAARGEVPHCGSDNVQDGTTRPVMPYRCRKRGCRKFFSVRADTVMESSKLGHQVWVMAMYFLLTDLNGHSSIKLHRDLGITQRAAWHVARRIRESWSEERNMQQQTVLPVINDRIDEDAIIYTDESTAYAPPENRVTVNHGVKEYVRDMAHINGLESFWPHLKRAYHGTDRHTSRKHLQHYVNKSSGSHNMRCADTIDQMKMLVWGIEKKRLKYADLTRRT